MKQSPTTPNADTGKHCQYHRNYGHTIEGCQALKDKIEELVQAGHLRKFVKTTITTPRSLQRDPDSRERSGRRDGRTRDDHRRSNIRKRSESPVRRTRPKSESPERRSRTKQKVREVINTIAGPVSLGVPPQEVSYIAGGFAGGGCSNSARKKHLRVIQSVHLASTHRRPHIPPITFTDGDFTAIDPAQDDPMVITVEIDKFAIAKVLVDQGSSVDILYWETFKKMQISEAEILMTLSSSLLRFLWWFAEASMGCRWIKALLGVSSLIEVLVNEYVSGGLLFHRFLQVRVTYSFG